MKCNHCQQAEATNRVTTTDQKGREARLNLCRDCTKIIVRHAERQGRKVLVRSLANVAQVERSNR